MILMALLAGVAQPGLPAQEHTKEKPAEAPQPVQKLPPTAVATITDAIAALTVAPPPPPPPGPPRGKLSRLAAPATPPQDWVSSDDYPAEALRNGETGTAGVRLDIDPSGAPSACYITSSTGSAVLDRTTCDLLSARARFTPALDRKKRPVASSFSTRFSWRLPETPPMPITSWAIVVRMTVGEDGSVQSCEQQNFDSPGMFEGMKPCLQWPGHLADMVQERMRGAAKGPVHLVMLMEQDVEGRPFPAGYARPAGLRTYMSVDVGFEIMPDGTSKQCHFVELRDSTEPEGDKAACGPIERYVPFADHDGKPYKARFGTTFFSDGAAPAPEPVKLMPAPPKP